ncbi:Tigger transposable element-derived protein 6, partial [Geodia barretti]
MPKRKRSFCRRRRSESAPAVLLTSRRQSKRKQWADEEMAAAMSAVRNGMAIKRAAEEHGVPPSTLRDRISGRVVHGTKPGPRPYLSLDEEKELGSFLKSCANLGYGKTRRDVMHIVQSAVADKGLLKGTRLSTGWWKRFLQRQPDLSLRRGDSTAHVRMDAVNADTMKQYFALLNDVMTEFDLHSKPSQIYNVDESGIPFDPRAPNIVTTRGTKKVRYRQSGRKGQVTIVGCASASGHALPPMVIFDAKRLNAAWTMGEFPGTKYGLSDNGWINSDLFEAWLCEHFVPHAVSARPLLLILDGHSTHYQPKLLRLAKEHDIIMLCLPPHTTHEAQPLDCGVFGPLKSHWSNVCHSYLQQNPGRVITRFQF